MAKFCTPTNAMLLILAGLAVALAVAISKGVVRIPRLEGFDSCAGQKVIRYTNANDQQTCIDLNSKPNAVVAVVQSFTVPSLPIKVYDPLPKTWTTYTTPGKVVKTTPGRQYMFTFNL